MGLISTATSLFLFIVSDFYPCYYSLKGYRSPNTVADIEYWHKYWIIRSFLIMIEFLWGDFIQRIPGIILIQITIYMFLAVFGGAGLIYDKALGPFLNRNEQRIDDGIELIKSKASYYFGLAAKQVIDYAKQQFFALLLRGNSAPPPVEVKKVNSGNDENISEEEKTG